jgi:hypothetical protein
VPSFHFRYRIDRLEDGRLDVRRSVHVRGEPKDAAVAVPFQVAVRRDDVDENLLKKKNMRQVDGELYNAVVDGRLFLQGEITRAELPIQYEPVSFWLDPEQRVFGEFLREDRVPQIVRLQDAYDAEAAGDLARALGVLERLSVEPGASDEGSPADEADDEASKRSLRIEADLYRARLAMDMGQLSLAGECLDRARARIPKQWHLESVLDALTARMDVLTGNYGPVFKRYHRDLMSTPWRLDAENLLLLVIAAKQLDEQKVLGVAAKAAQARGAELGALGDGG